MEPALCDVCKDVSVGKILIQTNLDTGEPEASHQHHLSRVAVVYYCTNFISYQFPADYCSCCIWKATSLCFPYLSTIEFCLLSYQFQQCSHM